MAHIDIQRSHTLGLDGARRVADRVAADLRASHHVRSDWQGDTLHVRGPGLKGQLTATDTDVHIVVRLGVMARPFRAALEGEIHRRLDALTRSPSPSPHP